MKLQSITQSPKKTGVAKHRVPTTQTEKTVLKVMKNPNSNKEFKYLCKPDCRIKTNFEAGNRDTPQKFHPRYHNDTDYTERILKHTDVGFTQNSFLRTINSLHSDMKNFVIKKDTDGEINFVGDIVSVRQNSSEMVVVFNSKDPNILRIRNIGGKEIYTITHKKSKKVVYNGSAH